VIDPEGKIAKQVVGENPEFYMYLDALKPAIDVKFVNDGQLAIF